MPAYRWDVGAKRYRDAETGRFLSREKALEYVDGALQAGRSATGTLANLVAEGTISAADWRDKMRQEIKDEYIRQYLSARGGLSQMTPADWGSIGGMLTEQYRYLDKFYGEVAAGNLTEGQIAARAGMYVNSAREANERAHGRSQGMPDLDRYPGSGSTECLTNCKCFLRIDTTADGWDVYWTLGDSEHCDGCLELAASWSPLRIKSTKSGDKKFDPLVFDDQKSANEWAINAYSDWAKNLTDDELEAIRRYQGTGFIRINRILRDDSLDTASDKNKKYIADLKSALDKAIVPNDLIVVRYFDASVVSQMQTGTEFSDRGFLSTSLRKDWDWDGIRVEISVPANTRGGFIGNLSEDDRDIQQSELLLQFGQKFRVVEKTDSSIRLEIIP